MYNGKKESDKGLRKLREWKTEIIRESKKFIFCLGMHIIGDEKPFYRLSKWLPLIFSLMNINETHK